MLTMDRDTIAALGFDLDRAIAEYGAALNAHAGTEGIPAPAAHPLVERIVKGHGGNFRIAERQAAPATGDPELRADPAQRAQASASPSGRHSSADLQSPA